MVCPGLYNSGFGALYRTFFQEGTGLVCGYRVWKMGDDPVHGVCPSADGSDLSENIPL